MSAHRFFSAVLILGLAASAAAPGQTPVGSAFSYQGSLTDSGGPANGDFDFQFDLYAADSGGSTVEPTFFADDVMVTNGLFTVLVDFGAVFHSDARWIEVAVREGSSTGPYTPLMPRQKVTPAPIAMRALGGVGPPNALTVLSTGQVGIGTQNPARDLHVEGDIWATGALQVGNSVFVNTLPDLTPCTDCITASGPTINFIDENLCTTGQVAIGNCAPLTSLHLTGTSLTGLGGFINAESAILENDIARLGLYSDWLASSGSGITLGQIGVGGLFTDKWSIIRAAPAGPAVDLYVMFGDNADPAANTAMLHIQQNGDTLLVPQMGNVGVGEHFPERALHVTTGNMASFWDFLHEEDAIVEDQSGACLGLYSNLQIIAAPGSPWAKSPRRSPTNGRSSERTRTWPSGPRICISRTAAIRIPIAIC